MSERIETPSAEPPADVPPPSRPSAPPLGAPLPPPAPGSAPGSSLPGSPSAGSSRRTPAVDNALSRWWVSLVDEVGGDDGVSFESAGAFLEWWYRPLLSARTWKSLGWLFIGAIWGPLMFVAMVAVASLVFALTFALIGLLLVVPAFAVINGMANVERRRAEWVGDAIPPRQLAESSGGIVSPIVTRLGDPARWRQVLFFTVFLVLAPLLFSVALGLWVFVVRLAFSGDFSPSVGDLIRLAFAAVLAGFAPRVTVGLAVAGRAFAAALLGPNEANELQERVTELSDQRQQILEAVAAERRRIERNLHDGVQQQLVALGIDIGRAQARLANDPEGAGELLDAARDKIRGSVGELRLIGRGLNPAVLDDRGLDAALSAVVAGSPIPISVAVSATAALDDDIAATAYYVANEAVANILKHSQARVASIRLESEPSGGGIRLTVHDDGRGGADPSRGTGLAGMRARVEGVDGTFVVDSPVGGPTRLIAVLPTDSHATPPTNPGGRR